MSVDGWSNLSIPAVRNSSKFSWGFEAERDFLEKGMPRYAREHGWTKQELIKAYRGWYKGFAHRLEHGRFDNPTSGMVLRANELIDCCMMQIRKHNRG